MPAPHDRRRGAGVVAGADGPRETVASALRSSAIDLGPPGVDNSCGFGLLDALAAAKWLAPAAFALPPRPDVRTRSAHH
jgi:hypothetical protein